MYKRSQNLYIYTYILFFFFIQKQIRPGLLVKSARFDVAICVVRCISGLWSRQLCDRPEKLLEKSFAVVAAAAAELDSASCKINVFALDVCPSDLAFPQYNNLFFLCRNNSSNCHLYIECSHCKTTDWRKKLNDIRQEVPIVYVNTGSALSFLTGHDWAVLIRWDCSKLYFLFWLFALWF